MSTEIFLPAQQVTFSIKAYLYNRSRITFLQKVQPYQTGTEPPLQDDDATHHFFVKSIIKQPPPLLLEEYLCIKEGVMICLCAELCVFINPHGGTFSTVTFLSSDTPLLVLESE